jgi:hypothetical protein
LDSEEKDSMVRARTGEVGVCVVKDFTEAEWMHCLVNDCGPNLCRMRRHTARTLYRTTI